MNTTIQGLLAGQTEANELEEILKPGITRATMKGLVYGGPGIIELKNIPIPEILKPTDAVVKILKTTICGTDLGISHGKTPTVLPGTTLGHEGVGVIDEVGQQSGTSKKVTM
jgi:alcohol dehydrogenase